MENFSFCAVPLTHFAAMFLFASMDSRKETLAQNEFENGFQQDCNIQLKSYLGNNFFGTCCSGSKRHLRELQQTQYLVINIKLWVKCRLLTLKEAVT